MNNTYSIMTSCDYKMYTYVSVMLCSIAEILQDDIVNFYILCDSMSVRNYDTLEKVESYYANLNIIIIPVDDSADYNEFAKHGGGWNNAAYFTMCCHKYLPSYIDRILYIDAGDIMFVDDIEPFFSKDFNNKTILAAAPLRYKQLKDSNILYSYSNIETPDELQGVLKGQFNSGSYMINLCKQRLSNHQLSDYYHIIDDLKQFYGNLYPSQVDRLYWGDQGLLSYMHLGDIEMYHDNLKILDMEYNFHLGIYNDYDIANFPSKPAILHFCGVPKPWEVDYGSKEIDQLISVGTLPTSSINNRLLQYYIKWSQYAQIVASL